MPTPTVISTAPPRLASEAASRTASRAALSAATKGALKRFSPASMVSTNAVAVAVGEECEGKGRR